ncbi:MAG: ornithine cyclodeaminase, nickel-pincer nucleotide-dependent [Candidatus Xenobia bacterium]
MDQFEEIVEVKGHLIDSGVMSKVLDTVIRHGANYEIQQFDVGRTTQDSSLARVRVSAGDHQTLAQTLDNLHEMGCELINGADARLVPAEKNACVPDDFYSTSNHKTYIRRKGEWVPVADQRMDACVVLDGETPRCRKLRDIKQGDMVVCGMSGVRVVPESRGRDKQDFVFMDNETSSERKVSLQVKRLAEMIRNAHQQGRKIVVVAGPVVVHTGGVEPLSQLICAGYVNVLLGGNAIAVHDIEHALYKTSLGVDLTTGTPVAHGHKNHMRAINAVNRCGNIAAAVEQGVLKSGIMYECVKNHVPFVLAGSIRDDGPLPDVEMDMIKAQEGYARHLKDASIVLMLSTMLHSIGTGNMIKSEVTTICVDINPAVVTKLSDRGSAQAVGLVTDIGLFLNLLARELCAEQAPSRSLVEA